MLLRLALATVIIILLILVVYGRNQAERDAVDNITTQGLKIANLLGSATSAKTTAVNTANRENSLRAAAAVTTAAAEANQAMLSAQASQKHTIGTRYEATARTMVEKMQQTVATINQLSAEANAATKSIK
jgi:hypothetical protein